MDFAYAHKSTVDVKSDDDWIPVLVLRVMERAIPGPGVDVVPVARIAFPGGREGGVIETDIVKVDDLIDGQHWLLGDKAEILYGTDDREEIIEEAGEDVHGKTRFHRLAMDPDDLRDYGEVMWR